MADGPSGQTHLSIYVPGERRYWTARFGVSEQRLRKAVSLVGSRITTVADYLGHRIS